MAHQCFCFHLKKKFFFKDLFICDLIVVDLCCRSRTFSSCGEQRPLFAAWVGFSLQSLLLLWSMGHRVHRLQYLQDVGSVAVALGSRALDQWLWHVDLVTPRHEGSSWTKDRNRVPCTASQILNHWTTSEALLPSIFTYIHTCTNSSHMCMFFQKRSLLCKCFVVPVFCILQ